MFVMTLQQLRDKLDPESQPGWMIGYIDSRGYRILLEDNKTVILSRDVVFVILQKPMGAPAVDSS